jgi:hypothetical protein
LSLTTPSTRGDSTVPLAYLPEHVWQVGGGLFSLVVFGIGVHFFIEGRSGLRASRSRPTATRVIGALQMVLGLAIGIAVVTVDAEPPCGACGRGHWGGSAGVVGLTVWILLVALGVALGIRRGRW